jgi:hypothetical protein
MEKMKMGPDTPPQPGRRVHYEGEGITENGHLGDDGDGRFSNGMYPQTVNPHSRWLHPPANHHHNHAAYLAHHQHHHTQPANLERSTMRLVIGSPRGSGSGSGSNSERSGRGLTHADSVFANVIDVEDDEDEDDDGSECFNVWNEDFTRIEHEDTGVVNADIELGAEGSDEDTVIDIKPNKELFVKDPVRRRFSNDDGDDTVFELPRVPASGTPSPTRSVTPPTNAPILASLDALHKTVAHTLHGMHLPDLHLPDLHLPDLHLPDFLHHQNQPSGQLHQPTLSSSSSVHSSPGHHSSSPAQYHRRSRGPSLTIDIGTPPLNADATVEASPHKKLVIKKHRSERALFTEGEPTTPVLRTEDIYSVVLPHGLGLLLTIPHPGNAGKNRGRFVVKGFRKNFAGPGSESPCIGAGIRIGDAIDRIDDVKVRDMNDIIMCLQAHKRSEKSHIKISVMR